MKDIEQLSIVDELMNKRLLKLVEILEKKGILTVDEVIDISLQNID
jgi:hypothetical protein